MSQEDADYENSVSMMDILQEQDAINEDADAVLGAADDTICSYSQGYLRQPLYSCNTCTSGKESRAGFCLACANNCHSDHTVVELFTKRNFRCDCGNSKLSKNPCTLQPEKDEVNVQNKYNHNFDGIYCTCKRPHPDPDNDDEDTMFQCIICEDWYHSVHLNGSSIPPAADFEEMVCPDCVDRLPFLQHYTGLNVPGKPSEDPSKTSAEKKSDQPLSTSDQKDGNQAKNGCTKGQLTGESLQKKALFLPELWRSKLCTCSQCKEEYAALEVSYLPLHEDTIAHYEQVSREKAMARSNGRTSRERSVDRELDALNSVDRVTRTEMVAEFNTMSTELREYLRKFADGKRVVTGDDINEFFTGLSARKKMRGNDGMPPNTCK